MFISPCLIVSGKVGVWLSSPKGFGFFTKQLFVVNVEFSCLEMLFFTLEYTEYDNLHYTMASRNCHEMNSSSKNIGFPAI